MQKMYFFHITFVTNFYINTYEKHLWEWENVLVMFVDISEFFAVLLVMKMLLMLSLQFWKNVHCKPAQSKMSLTPSQYL